MTEQYDPYKNTIAARINRALKHEYGLKKQTRIQLLHRKLINKLYIII